MTDPDGRLELRPARPGEERAMAAVLTAAWRTGYRGLLEDAVIDATSEAEWQTVLERGSATGSRGIVACDGGGRVVGFTRFGSQSTEDAGHIASVYVHPDAGGRGIGRRLVEAAAEALAADGHTTVTLWVFRDNDRARALYERCGFAVDGAQETDPRWGVPQVRYRRSSPKLARA